MHSVRFVRICLVVSVVLFLLFNQPNCTLDIPNLSWDYITIANSVELKIDCCMYIEVMIVPTKATNYGYVNLLALFACHALFILVQWRWHAQVYVVAKTAKWSCYWWLYWMVLHCLALFCGAVLLSTQIKGLNTVLVIVSFSHTGYCCFDVSLW